MRAIQRCRSFHEFPGIVGCCVNKRRLVKAIVRCLPVANQRTFSDTRHFEGWRKPDSDAVPVVQTPSAFFIIDKHWAHNVIEVSGLSKLSSGHKVVIFHANPGSGLLIESLLGTCDNKQIAWEPRKVYQDYLESLAELYKSRFACSNYSFPGDRRLKIFDELLKDDRQTTDDARYHIKIVGNVPEMYSFIPKLVMSLSGGSKFRLCRFGIIEPVLIVSGYEYRLMTESQHFWQKTRHHRPAAYELFLRTELLTTVPLSAFNDVVLKSTAFDYDQENLYLVRLSLRKDVNSVCNREDIGGIMVLLRIVSNIKAHRVIPAMERLCPDVGLTLLELGISMMDKFYDIPLDMWPEIYRAVTTSSQFSCSALYHIFLHKNTAVAA